jgi:hypothetical protein
MIRYQITNSQILRAGPADPPFVYRPEPDQNCSRNPICTVRGKYEMFVLWFGSP